MKILFISGREPSYTRNDVILKGLKLNGVKIIQCTSCSKYYLFRYLISFSKFLTSKKDYDVVFVGFYGAPLVPLMRLFTKKPIIFDAFVSAYQTLCFDRKSYRPGSIIGRMAYFLDKVSCKLSDKVILDTNAHISYFVKTFKIPEKKFFRVFVGANDSLFYPRKDIKVDRGLVFSYSQYQKVHGIEYIVKAANILRDNQKIRFKLVGAGRERTKIDEMVKKLKLKNIQFIDWVPYNKLPYEIAKADMCLGGHFGETDKANMLIAGKTFQFVAMSKPTILGECQGNLEVFTNLKDCYICKRGDGKEIADSILYLMNHKSKMVNIGNNGYLLFQHRFSPSAIGKEIVDVIKKEFFKQ